MFSVAIKSIVLSAIMLDVDSLNVVALKKGLLDMLQRLLFYYLRVQIYLGGG